MVYIVLLESILFPPFSGMTGVDLGILSSEIFFLKMALRWVFE